MKLSNIKKIHFIGIGGVGMVGIAEMLINQGFNVSGSDLVKNKNTTRLDNLGAKIFIGHNEKNIRDADVVVYSSAVNESNPEMKAAKSLNITLIPRAEMLSSLMRGFQSIAVAGSHGKTTTTSLIADIFIRANLDPTFIIGGKILGQENKSILGSSEYLIVEADESDASFLHLNPEISVVTNIDNDHLDFYANDLEKLDFTFLQFLENLPFYGAKWMQHSNRDNYWKHGSLCENYDSLTTPTLAFGGWADNYMNTVSNLIENVTNTTVKGIVGPWVHQYPHTADPMPQIGFLQEALRWWDRWLKGHKTGVEEDPNYRIYLQESVKPSRKIRHRPGHWIVEKDWPKSIIKSENYNLSCCNILGGKPDSLNYIIKSPQICGFAAGSYFPMSSSVPEQPGNQSQDDAYSLSFDSDITTKVLDIVGRPKIRLTLRSNKTRAHLCVRLCDVSPDGLSTRITYGLLNLAHKDSHENPSSVPVDEDFDVELELDQTAYKLLAGNRLRVAISNSYWPLVWPVSEQATLTLVKGNLILPVRPESSKPEYTFSDPECAKPWSRTTIRPPSYSKKVITDQTNEAVTLEIFDDHGIVEDDHHKLQMGTIVREKFSIHPDDPLCASGEVHWTQTLKRNKWNIRTEIYNSLTSDKQNFYMFAKVKAYEDEKLIFEKDFNEKISRSYH